jgi:chromosome segregation ATPase
VVEGYSSKYFEVSLKLEELQKERDELDARLREREVTIDRLRGKNKLHEEKIKSMNEYIGAEGQTQQFWKHQSKILVKKLEKVRLSKIEQEEEVVIMKGQIVIKQKEIEELTAEVVDLRQTKDQLDSELLAAEKTQQSILLELKEEASALLEEKERALNTLKIVQASHAKVIADHEEQINVLRDDVATYQKELDDAKIILDGTEMNTNTSDTQDDSLLWKKKATNLSFRLDVLKDEAKVWKKEIARLTKLTDEDKLAAENKKLKKRMKELQVKVDVFKEEIKERNAKIKALRKQSLTTDAALLEGLLEGIDTEQKDTDFWKGGT